MRNEELDEKMASFCGLQLARKGEYWGENGKTFKFQPTQDWNDAMRVVQEVKSRLFSFRMGFVRELEKILFNQWRENIGGLWNLFFLSPENICAAVEKVQEEKLI